jgi:AcrR family transcriptional regulator
MTARPERVPAEEVKKRMLDAGRELALEAGAALTVEHLRLEEVIQRARVPRSSAYRLWPYREDYTDDLLCYLAGAGSWFRERTVFDPETFAVATDLLAGNKQLLATPVGRRSLLLEIVRLSTVRNYDALTDSAPWRLHMALVATLGSTRSGEARRRIAAALEDAQKRSRESMVALLSHLMGVLGMRLRDPGYTLEHVQLAGGLLIQSLALRNVQVQAALGGETAEGGPVGLEDAGVPPEAKEVMALLNTPVQGPGLGGEPAEWTLTARAYLGVLDTFIELDPDFTPPTL